MRVLMFGWEFPPHISGGLGTACHGLTNGMASLSDMEILFVVPKAYGDEDQSSIRLLGAEDFPVSSTHRQNKELLEKIKYFCVESKMIPYVDPEEYQKLQKSELSQQNTYITTDVSGKVKFTGKYGPNLMQEIANYALVSKTIASQHEFDVIHAHDWLTYAAGITAKQASGKPLVVHVHATDFDRSGGKVNPDVYRMEKEGMEAADRVITVSNLTRNIVIKKYGINPEKVVTVHNAVEPLSRDEDLQIKKGFDEKVVTFLGRITLQKGPEYFIEAAHQVLQKMDNVKFVMAGSGDMMNKMIRRAAQLGITDKFHFTGFLKGKDVYRMFSMSDVYVMPSTSEPFGISPLEAMQSQVPVIISKQSGVSEILTHAIKVDYWDIKAMADAIYGALNYPSLYNMAQKLGTKEVDSLKWKNAASKVKKVYQSVLN